MRRLAVVTYGPPDFERRRDRRIRISGEILLLTLERREDLVGGIVDVSAGGVRFRVRPGRLPAVGDPGAVDLRITLAATPGGSPTLRLTGRGMVVRTVEGGGGDAQVVVRFDAPLKVRDAFAPPNGLPDAAAYAV